jgi:hypothetical protein
MGLHCEEAIVTCTQQPFVTANGWTAPERASTEKHTMTRDLNEFTLLRKKMLAKPKKKTDHNNACWRTAAVVNLRTQGKRKKVTNRRD